MFQIYCNQSAKVGNYLDRDSQIPLHPKSHLGNNVSPFSSPALMELSFSSMQWQQPDMHNLFAFLKSVYPSKRKVYLVKC